MDTDLIENAGAGTVCRLPLRRVSRFHPGVSVHQWRSVPWVLGLMPDLRTREAARAVLDLHRVTFMDASGLSALMVCRRQATAIGGCVRLVAPSAPVRRILMLTGTSEEFTTFWTLDAALSAPVLSIAREPSLNGA